MGNMAVFEDISRIASKAIGERLGVPKEAAEAIGTHVAAEIRELWGGLTIYVNKTDIKDMVQKNREVYEAWKIEGFSPELCRRFKLSEARVRQIVAKERRKERTQSQ